MDGLSAEDRPPMTFHVARNDGRTATVTVSGELDIATIAQLERGVAAIIESRPDRLVVDVRELRFADSSAIALWMRWAAAVGELELRDASPLLRRVINSMGLEGRLRLA